MSRKCWLLVGLILAFAVVCIFFYRGENPKTSLDTKAVGDKGSVDEQAPSPFSFKDSKQYEEFKTGTSPVDIASLPMHLRIVIGVEKKDDYWARKNAIRQLGVHLSRLELNALYAFLTTKADRQSFDADAFNSIKNDVLDMLVLQEPLPEDLAAQMVFMFRDRSLDDMWREYCVQHFQRYYERKWPVGSSAIQDPERMAFESVYWEAASEWNTRVAGAALLGLDQLSSKHEEIDRDKLTEATESLAFREDGNPGSRLTAIRLCGQRGLTNSLSSMRSLAVNSTNALLQLTAVASIGDLGSDADIELLNNLMRKIPGSKLTQNAIERAIKHIQERQK